MPKNAREEIRVPVTQAVFNKLAFDSVASFNVSVLAQIVTDSFIAFERLVSASPEPRQKSISVRVPPSLAEHYNRVARARGVRKAEDLVAAALALHFAV